jgi:hypothetical protein
MSKTHTWFFRIVMTLVALVCAACAAGPSEKGGAEEGPYASATLALEASSPVVYPLAMGATNLQVGTVTVWNDETNLYVKFDTFAGYELADAHLCASTAPFAWTSPGQCPYNAGSLPAGTTSWLFTVPLESLGIVECGTVIYLQSHASINAAGTTTGVGSAYGGTFKGHHAFDIACDVPPEGDPGCTLTQGYWKTHPSAWPVNGLTIGDTWYTKSKLIQLLKTPPKGGDASLILAHQLIAALLNAQSGAFVPSEVQEAIDGAQAWMSANEDADGLLPYGTRPTADGVPNSAAWDAAINYAAVLDLYNNGNAGTSHCE